MLGRASRPHLNKSLARSNKNPFYQGFLTGIATINLREYVLLDLENTFLVESFLFSNKVSLKLTNHIRKLIIILTAQTVQILQYSRNDQS